MKAWGKEAQIDLYECTPYKIRDAKIIEDFVVKLCDLIEMKRFGDPVIIHFGEEERVAGFSMFQLIETSNVSAHFANETNNIYLNVFSCKTFDAQTVADFALEFFDAKDVKTVINYRQ